MNGDLPRLVTQALKLAEARDFAKSCSVETGRLLRILASQIVDGVVGESSHPGHPGALSVGRANVRCRDLEL